MPTALYGLTMNETPTDASNKVPYLHAQLTYPSITPTIRDFFSNW